MQAVGLLAVASVITRRGVASGSGVAGEEEVVLRVGQDVEIEVVRVVAEGEIGARGVDGLERRVEGARDAAHPLRRRRRLIRRGVVDVGPLR